MAQASGRDLTSASHYDVVDENLRRIRRTPASCIATVDAS